MPASRTNGSSPFEFERDVLEASHRHPVLVDFWAPWCGPCQVLSPVLEKLADEAGGQWELVKINTDEHPALSQQAGIRGIPAVKLYVDGDMTAEFTGALPEPLLRRWLDEYLPTEGKQLLEEARALMNTGDRPAAQERLERVVEIDPENEDGRALLARLVALDDVARAKSLLQGLQHRAEAQAIDDLERFLALRDDASGLPEGPAREAYLAAAEDVESGDLDGAIEKLIAALKQDRYYDEDGPRRVLIALFLLLGERNPISRKHRPEFNRSLY